MKFGQVPHPESVDFSLPADHPDTVKILAASKKKTPFEAYVGCAKWNRTDLKGFYPRGTKDELSYYATQFNSIELNATFYHAPDARQVETWRDKTPPEFRFYSKIPSTVSHFRRLVGVREPVLAFCDAINHFEDRLGIPFLQLHDNFGPANLDRLQDFLDTFPRGMPLAVELRNAAWFAEGADNDQVFALLKKHHKEAILVDTAGRRDMLHMRLTTPRAFVRFVGANHPSDYQRLDDWLKRITVWHKQGLRSLHFFLHQHIERESPLLSAYFIEGLNKALGIKLKIPVMA
jgi:uncharacterized protein YecE (DUF72 family)